MPVASALILPSMLQMVLGTKGLGATSGTLPVVMCVARLTLMKGAEHHRQRKVLNPMFSTSALRYMPPIFYTVTKKVRAAYNLSLNMLILLQFIDSLKIICSEGTAEVWRVFSLILFSC